MTCLPIPDMLGIIGFLFFVGCALCLAAVFAGDTGASEDIDMTPKQWPR